jgi:dihydrolipoamide dehydrogenase
MQIEAFDVALIGAGQGGLPAAHMAARLGATVVLIEMREVGGTWVNEGCIPTKTLLRSAEVMHLVRERAAEFGVRGIEPEKLSFDLAAAVAR